MLIWPAQLVEILNEALSTRRRLLPSVYCSRQRRVETDINWIIHFTYYKKNFQWYFKSLQYNNVCFLWNNEYTINLTTGISGRSYFNHYCAMISLNDITNQYISTCRVILKNFSCSKLIRHDGRPRNASLGHDQTGKGSGNIDLPYEYGDKFTVVILEVTTVKVSSFRYPH